jgi:hypothetical protein
MIPVASVQLGAGRRCASATRSRGHSTPGALMGAQARRPRQGESTRKLPDATQCPTRTRLAPPEGLFLKVYRLGGGTAQSKSGRDAEASARATIEVDDRSGANPPGTPT